MSEQMLDAGAEARAEPLKYRPTISVAEIAESAVEMPDGVNAHCGWFIDSQGRRLDYEVIVTRIDGKQVNRMWEPYVAQKSPNDEYSPDHVRLIYGMHRKTMQKAQNSPASHSLYQQHRHWLKRWLDVPNEAVAAAGIA